jgi:hypothetical protein
MPSDVTPGSREKAESPVEKIDLSDDAWPDES